MGGPINGSKTTGIIIPTSVQISSDLISYWTSMTCFYDPMWIPEPDRVTLPITMFHITGIKEVGQTTVTKKRVILYEPQSDNDVVTQADIVRPSVMRSIVDNVIREPKTYAITAVVPYKSLARYAVDGVSLINDAIVTFLAMLGTADSAADFGSVSFLTNPVMSLAETMSTVMNTMDMLPSMNDISRINKNSLDAMWERSHFLCMKLWTGFDYKFVMITNLEIEKSPREDDVYRATMQVQEMPVLVTNLPKNAKLSKAKSTKYASMVNWTQKKLSAGLVAATGIPSNVVQ